MYNRIEELNNSVKNLDLVLKTQDGKRMGNNLLVEVKQFINMCEERVSRTLSSNEVVILVEQKQKEVNERIRSIIRQDRYFRPGHFRFS